MIFCLFGFYGLGFIGLIGCLVQGCKFVRVGRVQVFQCL